MSKKGITLIELLVVIAILGIVLAITFKSYISILKIQTQQSGIASGNLNTDIALEVLRKDIEMAGFGLPRITNGSCSEAVSDSTYTPDPSTLNTNCDPLAPFSLSDNTGPNQSDVLAIRSSVAALNSSTEHWGYVSSNGYKELGKSGDVSDVVFNIIDPKSMEPLQISPCKLSSLTLVGGKVYLVFGLGDKSVNMPFNRVDYFLYRPANGMPSRCSPNSYELYRATIDQSDGKRNRQPIFDCVEDFQVVFGLDTNDNGTIDKWSSSLPSDLYDLDKQLKQLRVFIVYQEGKKDPNFSFSGSISIGDSDTGEIKKFTPTGDDVHYRWRMTELVVYPMNITLRERKLQ
ncbi:PilW family protein [Hippea alviniae]|uniref:PilW family protein n=1 Tax=Hippea alviniae TaxID=1279027 RepID=UPI0003B67A42|nr:PilW family protein [Hippea alviniae]